MVLTGCGAKKAVQIPPDWQVAQSVQQPAEPIDPKPSPPKASAIVKRAPIIKETDLPAGSQPYLDKASDSKTTPKAPQHAAAMHLVEQGKTALGEGKADRAISLLEQALQIDTQNGEAYYTLSRAWLMKGARQKALQFAQKAETLLQADPVKLKQLYLYEADLWKELGDTKRMEGYRQKASKL